MNKYGSDSGLYNDITTRDLRDKIELKLRKELQRAPADLDTFEVLVQINGNDRNLINVGYGVSQILPVILEAIARPDHTWFAIQQPELHLHPKAQAALGDFIFKTNFLDNQYFILETHSDYIIDRYRLRLNRALREKQENVGIGQVLFFSKTNKGNTVEAIELNIDGSYPGKQPKAFRNFFVREQLELLSI